MPTKEISPQLNTIIQLKNQNKRIGAKIKAFKRSIETNEMRAKSVEFFAFSPIVYERRIERDKSTIEMLEQLQQINSNLIARQRRIISTFSWRINPVGE